MNPHKVYWQRYNLQVSNLFPHLAIINFPLSLSLYRVLEGDLSWIADWCPF
jgi:hypothetical protein